jgi:hypothetical protein
MIDDIRPEFKQLMIDAWYNYFFAIAFAAPVLLHFLGFVLFPVRWKVVAATALPMSIFFCWAFVSMGVFHVYDVWADNAVTDTEFGIVSNDTGRTFTPVFTAPPVAIAYSLACYVTIGLFCWIAKWLYIRRLTNSGTSTVTSSSTTI